MSSLPKFFEKTTRDGRHVELFLDSYCGEWLVQARVNGKIQWAGGEEPCRITDRERARRKLPPEAVLGVRGLLFMERDAAAIEEGWARVKAEAEAARAKAAAELEPVGYVFEEGCDRGNTYRVLWPDGADLDAREVAEERLGTDAIEQQLTLDDFRRIAEETAAEPIPVNLGIYWGYRYDRAGFDGLMTRAREVQVEKDAAKAARTAAREADRQAKIAAARESGKPVAIESWIEECDGSVEECSTDVIERLAQPDGSITTRRIHTH